MLNLEFIDYLEVQLLLLLFLNHKTYMNKRGSNKDHESRVQSCPGAGEITFSLNNRYISIDTTNIIRVINIE